MLVEARSAAPGPAFSLAEARRQRSVRDQREQRKPPALPMGARLDPAGHWQLEAFV